MYSAIIWLLLNYAEPNRGCLASAYQAQRYGHDLEENLLECK